MSCFLKITKTKKGVAYINLNRPEIHNAFNNELIFEIIDCFESVDSDESINLIVFSGVGRSFCAGADLNWMKSMVDFSKKENFEDSQKLFQMFETINNCSKPVIGKINGHALGGGMGLMAVCDYALTHDKAKFGFTETRLGLIPAVISSFCINKIGEANARAWFLSGEQFSANQALAMGIVQEVTSVDRFEARSEELINSFLKAGPKASVKAKTLIREVLSAQKDDVKDLSCMSISECRISSEAQEGMNALLDKRKAKWMEL